MKVILRVSIPDWAWKIINMTNASIETIPLFDSQGNLQFEVDAVGKKMHTSALNPVRETHYKRVLSLQDMVKEHQVSTEQTAAQARERPRQSRETRIEASQRRRQKYVRRRIRMQQRVIQDLKREKNVIYLHRPDSQNIES